MTGFDRGVDNSFNSILGDVRSNSALVHQVKLSMRRSEQFSRTQIMVFEKISSNEAGAAGKQYSLYWRAHRALNSLIWRKHSSVARDGFHSMIF